MPLKDAYLESQVMTADPLELVRLLYRAASDATCAAQACLATGRIADRSARFPRRTRFCRNCPFRSTTRRAAG